MSRPRQVSDEQIFRTVCEAVREQGAKISLDVVAQRLGVTQPALLKRFGTRHQLMLAALIPAAMQMSWAADWERGPDDRPLEAQLEELLSGMARNLYDTMPVLSALWESGIPRDAILKSIKSPAPLTEGLRVVSSWLTRAEGLGLAALGGVSPESVAGAMMSAVHGRVHVSTIFGRPAVQVTDQKFIADLAKVFSRAVGATQVKVRGRTASARGASRRRHTGST